MLYFLNCLVTENILILYASDTTFLFRVVRLIISNELQVSASKHVP